MCSKKMPALRRSNDGRTVRARACSLVSVYLRERENDPYQYADRGDHKHAGHRKQSAHADHRSARRPTMSRRMSARPIRPPTHRLGSMRVACAVRNERGDCGLNRTRTLNRPADDGPYNVRANAAIKLPAANTIRPAAITGLRPTGRSPLHRESAICLASAQDPSAIPTSVASVLPVSIARRPRTPAGSERPANAARRFECQRSAGADLKRSH